MHIIDELSEEIEILIHKINETKEISASSKYDICEMLSEVQLKIEGEA